MHDDDERDGTDDASYNFDEGRWTCFAGCEGGALGSLLWRIGVDDRPEPGIRPLDPAAESKPLPSEGKLAGWHERLLGPDGDHARAYLQQQRGISRDTIERFGLGWDGDSLVFPVRDASGELLTVRRRRPGSGQTTYSWPGHKAKHPYPLPEFLAAVEERPGAPIVVCEGEPDCLLLWDQGFIALTCPTGAGSLGSVVAEVAKQHPEAFAGRTVVVWADHDDTGWKARDAVMDAVAPLAGAVVPIESDEEPLGQDVTDLWKRWGRDFAERVDAIIARGARDAVDAEVEAEYRRQKVRALARDRLAQERAAEAFAEPPSRLTLSDELSRDLPPVSYSIESLHPVGGNTLLAAEYKAGKTTLLGNLTKALCDGRSFLGLFPVRDLDGKRVAFWNMELDERQFLAWLRGLNIRDSDRAAVLNLRGYRVPLTSQVGEEFAVRWLGDRDVDVWILDPFARAFDGDNENDNSQVGRFLEALDVIKRRADVADLVMSAHLGRQRFEEGEERVRGATRLDDWADVRWLLNKDRDGHRYFAADGRDVRHPEGRLVFDPATRALQLSGGSRRDERTDAGIREALRVVAAEPGIKKGELLKAMRGDTNDNPRYVAEAVSRGLLRVEDAKRGAKLHHLTEAGEKLHLRRVEMGEEA